MVATQTVMGCLIVALCMLGLWNDRWFFENTRKGRRLADWFGEVGGMRALRILFVAGILFGALLAVDFIRPIHWNKP